MSRRSGASCRNADAAGSGSSARPSTTSATRSTSRRPPEGEEAIRAFRPRAIAAVTGGSYGPSSVEPTVERIADDRRLLATAFARLPEPWQTVLWHTHVEQLTAAEVSPLVGRTVNEVTELLSTAERGLIDAYLLEYQEADDFDEKSAALIPLLGGYVRSSLPAHEQRLVEAHLADDAAGDVDPATGVRRHGADDSRRLIEVASSVPESLAPAIAPGITGMSVEAHRAALGTATRSFGTAAMSAERSDRVRRAVVVGSAIAVVLVLVGVAYLVRQPFDNDDTGPPLRPRPRLRDLGHDRAGPGDVERDDRRPRPTRAWTPPCRPRPGSICVPRRRVRTTRSS